MASMAARRANPLLTSFPHFLTWRSLGFRTMCSGRLGFASTDPPSLKVLETFKEEFEIGSHLVTLETGKIARFANGSVVFGMGETKVLSTVTSSSADGARDFLPLTVDYQEKLFAQGLIPNTFMKREGAPKERELLCGRLIDRPIRPLFPAGFYHEVQVMASVLSSDGNHDPDVMAANATSAALMLSDVPWGGPIGVIRIGRVCGKFIVNPTMDELNLSDLNLVYACTRDKTLMIDVQAREISEKDLEAGLRLAHPEAVKYLEPQIRLAAKAGKQKKEYKLSMISDKTLQKVRNLAEATIESVFTDPKYGKFERGEALDKITQDVRRELEGECDEESLRGIPKAVDKVRKEVVRKRIIAEGLRLDGRRLDEVRPLYCEAGTLPILHGSSLFSRGDTQVLCTVTLGAPDDAQRLDSLVGPPKKRFMLHYSFPPFSINEVGKRTGLNRREVGHGTLAEKALLAVLPPEDEFAYVVRVNSEVMASDGSTSMATVCGGSMALMDAGIPLREHVAGVSVGLVSEVDPLTGEIKDYRILTDILGLEDHLGDMDFKIAGTQNGITAIQLDIKPAGIPLDIICESLEPARKGRLHILAHMEQEIDAPRNQDDRNSQRLVTLKYGNDDLRSLIGPLGALKRRIEEETGARISVGDGTLTIVAKNSSVMEKVLEKVDFIIGRKIEVGGVYKGVVTSIKEYGAFVEFNGGQNGLLHISELSHDPVSRVSDVVSVGQYLSLMCIGQDVRGNIKLSLKATLSQSGSSSKSVVEGSVPRTKDIPDVRSTVEDVSNGQEDQTSVSDELAATKSDPYTSSTPSVLIRSAAECDEVEESAKSKSSGTTPKATTASKFYGKSKTPPPEDDLLDSLFSDSGSFSSSKRSKSSLQNKTKQVVNHLETEKMNASGLVEGLRSTAKSNGVSKLGGKLKTALHIVDELDSLDSDIGLPSTKSKRSKLTSERKEVKKGVNGEGDEIDEVEESAKSKSSGTTPKQTTASKLRGESKTPQPEDDLLDSLFSDSGPFSSSKRSKSSLQNKAKQVVNNLETEKKNDNGLVQGLRSTAKSKGVSKFSGKLKTALPIVDVLNSPDSDIGLPSTKSKRSKPTSEKKEVQKGVNGEGDNIDASEIETPLTAQNLKIGVTVSATVYQVRTHGLVLDLGSGIQGMYRFEENGKTDFEVGDELQVECSSFTSKGIPILKASS